MYKKSLFVLAILMLLSGSALAFQKEPEGFRDLKWGDPPTEDMEFESAFLSSNVYTRPTDKMNIENAEFYILYYSFYNQRFFAITGLFKNKENYDMLEIICREKFGEPKHDESYTLSWFSDEAAVFLNYDLIRGEGCLSFLGRKILFEWIEADKQKEKELEKKDLGVEEGLTEAPGTRFEELGARKVTYKPEFAYPEEMQQQNWEGSVIVEIDVTPDGNVVDVRIIASSGHPQFDEEIRRKARYYKFSGVDEPGIKTYQGEFKFSFEGL